jgi:hypothetical protein
VLPGFLGLSMLSCFPCFDVTQCVSPLCISYASGRDVSCLLCQDYAMSFLKGSVMIYEGSFSDYVSLN